jgi:hypothetical protein
MHCTAAAAAAAAAALLIALYMCDNSCEHCALAQLDSTTLYITAHTHTVAVGYV